MASDIAARANTPEADRSLCTRRRCREATACSESIRNMRPNPSQRPVLRLPLAIRISSGDCGRIAGNGCAFNIARKEYLSKRRRHDKQKQRPDEHTTYDDGGQRALHLASDTVGYRGR